jgi:hypothetical protein
MIEKFSSKNFMKVYLLNDKNRLWNFILVAIDLAVIL